MHVALKSVGGCLGDVGQLSKVGIAARLSCRLLLVRLVGGLEMAEAVGPRLVGDGLAGPLGTVLVKGPVRADGIVEGVALLLLRQGLVVGSVDGRNGVDTRDDCRDLAAIPWECELFVEILSHIGVVVILLVADVVDEGPKGDSGISAGAVFQFFEEFIVTGGEKCRFGSGHGALEVPVVVHPFLVLAVDLGDLRAGGASWNDWLVWGPRRRHKWCCDAGILLDIVGILRWR